MNAHRRCCRTWTPQMRKPHRRRALKGLLAAIALLPDDVFTTDQAFDSWAVICQDHDMRTHQFQTLWDFLRGRRFVLPLGRVHSGRGTRWYLSERAVRWLGWTGFPWAAGPAAATN